MIPSDSHVIRETAPATGRMRDAEGLTLRGKGR